MTRYLAAMVAAGLAASAAGAVETITFKYDVHGRLIRVIRSGTVNSGVQSSYTLDKADNRTNVTTTGAP